MVSRWRITNGLRRVNERSAVVAAFAVRPVVELKVLEAGKRRMVTFCTLRQKVEENTFFLKPSIRHLYLDQK